MRPTFIQQRGIAGATINIEQRLEGLRGFGMFGGLGADTVQNVAFEPVTIVGRAPSPAATHLTHVDDTGVARTAGGDVGMLGNDPAKNRTVGALSALVGALGLLGGYKLYKGGHPVAGVVVGLLLGVPGAVGGTSMLITGKSPYSP